MIFEYSDESIAVKSLTDLRLLIGSSADDLLFKFNKYAWLKFIVPYKSVNAVSHNREAFIYLIEKLITLEADYAR